MTRRRRRRCRSPAGTPPALEDEDILSLILVRLPSLPSSLPRASLVCKRWRRLVSNPYFHRLFRTHHRTPPLLGVFMDRRGMPVFRSTLDPPDAIPTERFSLWDDHADHGDDYGWDSEMLGCRHGRVLVFDGELKQVIVWCPVTDDRCYVDIPPEFHGRDKTGALLCAAGERGHAHGSECHSAPFQIVLIASGDEADACARVYSSETCTWGDPIFIAIRYVRTLSRPGTLIGDSLYWIIDGHDTDLVILEFDLERQGLAVFEIPPDIDDDGAAQIIPVEGVSVGLAVLTDSNLDIRERKLSCDGVAQWVLQKTVKLRKITGLSSKERGYMMLNGYDEHGNVIFLRTDAGVFMVQLESMQFRNLGKSNFISECAYHPYRSFYATEDYEIRNTDDNTDDSRDAANSDSVLSNNWSFNPKNYQQELMWMLTFHEMPFNLVESGAFRTFVASLNPLVQMSTLRQSTIRNDCIGAFKEQKLILQDVFKSADCRFSLSADTWTSDGTMEYMSVTSLFIDNGWKVQKRIIRFFSVEMPHNAVEIFSAVLKCIQDWNIDQKIFGLTLRNFAANDTIVDMLKRNLADKNVLPLKGKLFHNRCAAQVIDLIVSDGLKFIGSILGKIRESVKYIQSSPPRKKIFEKIIAQEEISCEQRPSLDFSTLWNTTYQMLDTAVKFRRAYDSLALQDTNYTDAPSFEEWETTEVVCRLLKVCNEATIFFSCSSSPTSNLYFHEIWKLKLTLDGVASEVDNDIRKMAKGIKKKFNKYWIKSYILLSIPVILDPRFKYMFVEFRLKQYFGADARKRLDRVQKVLRGLFDEYSSDLNDCGVDSTQHGRDKEIPMIYNDRFADWDEHLRNNMRSQVSTELDRYLDQSPVHLSDEFDILKWWKLFSPVYPTLAHIARDVLAVPASTVASESAFNTGERVISDSHSGLTTEVTEARICLQDWYRASGSDLSMKSTTDLSDIDDLRM